MKRRNAETGKLRRPLKRTKITEGMYGNSMLYLRFVMVWATVVLVDYMLDFRFEFLWPFWMMLRSLYDSFRYQGLAFSVFFICIALTSDIICFFFIPIQYIFFAASTYVWVQYVWFTFADKGVCIPTMAICCVVVYVEGLWRGSRASVDLYRPFAAHCVGYPVVTLGFSAKALIGHRLRQRRQRQVRAMNEFYFQLMRDALPESALEQDQKEQTGKESATSECGTPAGAPSGANGTSTSCPSGASAANGTNGTSAAGATDAKPNGSLRRRCKENGHCPMEHQQLHAKLEKLEKHLANKEREKMSASGQTSANTSTSTSTLANGTSVLGNGAACHAVPDDDEPKHDLSKGSAKSSKLEKKEASTLKEEKRKNKNKDKDKESSDSHKSTDNSKEQIFKDIESTKDCVKIKECNSSKDKEKEKEKEREKETKDKEREREREREQKEAKSCAEELKRVKSELAAVKASEAEAKRALSVAAAADRQRRADHNQLKQAHATLQHKVSAWRTGERAALERRLADERRARTHAETQLLRARHQTRTPSGECESESCRSQRASCESESVSLRRELQRARERAAQLQRDLALATEQVRSLESSANGANGNTSSAARGWHALHERAQHLERALSAETRVKLDLLSALGDAKRRLQIQDGLILRQEKEIEELKAQMLAVMPTEFVTPVSTGVSKLRLSDGSPLDPNASVYTPKQLCSDA